MIEHGKAEIDALADRFTGRMHQPSASLESTETEYQATGPDLSPSAVAARWGASRAFLIQFIRDELGDDPKLLELAEKTLQDGKEGLELIGGQREATEAPIEAVEAGLEVIVQTDGSRPAYFVRDNKFVVSSAPTGLWTDLLTDVLRQEAIEGILGSVGRIDISNFPVPFAGTGWLIGEDLIVTNRHVAQLFVDFFAAGGPQIRPERAPNIDFGHEYRGQESVGRRQIIDLVFSGATPIPTQGINHSLLDMAVFRLGPTADAASVQTVLPIGLGEQLASAQTQVIVVGYPARPGERVLGSVTETDRILRLLFDKLWGYKRLAPGEIMTPTLGKRTLLHDASTLGGNSGSLVMGIDSVPTVTGLHYGGTWGDRANWGHVMENVLDEQGLAGLPYATLRALSASEGVVLVTPGP